MKNIKQVAEALSVHQNTVRNWIKKGKIKSVKVERAIRIPDEEFERLTKGENK